jgi:hypothetical protein
MAFSSNNLPVIGSRVVLQCADREFIDHLLPPNGSTGTVQRIGDIVADDVIVLFDVQPDTDHQCDPEWLVKAEG